MFLLCFSSARAASRGAMEGLRGPLACRCPPLNDDDYELGVIREHDFVFLGTHADVSELVLRVKVAHSAAALEGELDHALRVHLGVLLRHGGVPAQHLPLFVADYIALHAGLHLDSLNGLLNVTLRAVRVRGASGGLALVKAGQTHDAAVKGPVFPYHFGT